MKIVADQAIPLVREAFEEFGTTELVPGRSISASTVHDAEILLVRSVTQVTDSLIKNSALRFVASATIGIEHIDTAALEARGIRFAWAPGSNADSVTQYVVAALLQLEKLRSATLSGTTLGIVGAGAIGSRVCRCAEALGMRCILNDPPLKALTGNELYRSLNELLEVADIVTLHVPLTREGPCPTYHMADAAFLRRMKAGAALINTSRGAVIDEAALAACHSRLGAIVLDVWENEPAINPETVALATIATPHIAGYSVDGKVNGTVMIHRAACDYFNHIPKWQPSGLCQTSCEEIDVRDERNPLLSAITGAYAQMVDDLAFREIMIREDPHERARGFDLLRSGYPRRFEFSHYTVRLDSSQTRDAAILAKLGFTTRMDHRQASHASV